MFPRVTLTVVVSTAWLLWLAMLLVWIVMERRSPAATLAWVMGLALIPFLGAAVYFLFGPRRLVRKRVQYSTARKALADALLQLPASTREDQEDVRQLKSLGLRAGNAPIESAEVTLFRGGEETYLSIAQAISAAQHHVHLEYYIWEPDETGKALRDLLVERARAGVQVRVLYDSMGSGRLPRGFFAELVKAGGKVAAFNPLRLASFRPRLINFRTHRKIVVCDGNVGFTGGINISDCHTRVRSGDQAWRDTHARFKGAGVHGLQWTFAENWQFSTGESLGREVFFPASKMNDPESTQATDGGSLSPVQILRSGPDRDVYAIHEFVFSAINAADERVWLTIPYLVPDEPVLLALRSAVHRGVDVRLIVPAKNDSRLVAAAMRSYYEELLASGVKLYEYTPRMLHAKTAVIDNELVIVGTANMDSRSFRLNFEIAAVVYDPRVVDTLAGWFEEDITSSREVRPRALRSVRFGTRLFESIARLFSPLL